MSISDRDEELRQREAASAEFDAVYAARQQEATAQPAREPLRLVSLVLILIAALLIVLLMLDMWGPTGSESRVNRRSIETVPGKRPIAGTIAVWVEGDSRVEDVLADAGVSHGDLTDLGQGRYVVEVTEGTEVQAVRTLKGRPGVSDAGYVFDPDAPVGEEAATTP